MTEQEIQILNAWKEELKAENESIKSRIDELEKKNLELSLKCDICSLVSYGNSNVEEVANKLKEYNEKKEEFFATLDEELKKAKRSRNINQLYIDEIEKRAI